MHLRPLASALSTTTCHTRLPFRFGVSTLTRAELCVVRLGVELPDGRRAVGRASDLLVPKWFEKDPATTLDEDTVRLRLSAEAAADVLLAGAERATAFDHWHRMYEQLVAPGPPDAPDRLRRGFGVAIWERALIDAACRAAGVPFARAVRTDVTGFDAGRVHAELAGIALADALPPEPRRRIAVRHTVGLVDALRAADVSEPVRDGLPECLDDDLREDGVRWLKVKVSGDRAHDRERLESIAAIVAEHDAPDDPIRLTLDGNEQYETLDELAALLEDLARGPAKLLLERTVAIEQPLARRHTFDPERHGAIDRVSAVAPLLIDEADADIDAFPRAVALGYRGVSVKNCKGVFRALANAVLCRSCGEGRFQSAEDLTNLPVIALQQDLATVATLGLAHVERNGHHYFRGLEHLPVDVAQAALREHGDLYTPLDSGARLRIEGGHVALDSVLAAPGYGYAGDWPTPERG